MYLKIKWKKISERLNWEKIWNKEFLNRFFGKLSLEVEKVHSLKYDILKNYNLLPENNIINNIKKGTRETIKYLNF